jgi:hypothetical protein
MRLARRQQRTLGSCSGLADPSQTMTELVGRIQVQSGFELMLEHPLSFVLWRIWRTRSPCLYAPPITLMTPMQESMRAGSTTLRSHAKRHQLGRIRIGKALTGAGRSKVRPGCKSQDADRMQMRTTSGDVGSLRGSTAEVTHFVAESINRSPVAALLPLSTPSGPPVVPSCPCDANNPRGPRASLPQLPTMPLLPGCRVVRVVVRAVRMQVL